MIDRILKIIEIKNLNKSQFYKITGLSNGFLDKVKDIGVSKLEYILNSFPDINPIWLITGQGSMFKEPAQPAPVQEVQPSNNDKYIAVLEAQLKDKDKILALQEEKIADLEEKLKFAEFRDKKDMDFKIKAQRKEKKAKDEIILAQTNTINLQNKEINALKSRHLPPDEPLQSTKGL